MTLLKILKYPNKKLTRNTKKVKQINKKIHKIIHNMFETMYHHNGIGLAAPQVDIHLKIIVIDIMQQPSQPIALLNPKIIYRYENITTEEECLSLPGIKKKITRFNKIKINALNYYGKPIVITAENLLSICIQHEMDHLNGKLLIDY
ncbi:peptide deformylase [Buchnera aphidicola]|uniref:peptide deformylase n=1 Tax=Buchnera aphidicola TaxID=9 RepID=UPI0031B7F707